MLALVSVGYFSTITSGFNAVKSSGVALQAQKYAEIEANTLSLMDYDGLDGKITQNSWQNFPENTEWQYYVVLGSEQNISEEVKQRIADIKIRKVGDSEPRFQTQVPLLAGETSEKGGENGGGKVFAPPVSFPDFRFCMNNLEKCNSKYWEASNGPKDRWGRPTYSVKMRRDGIITTPGEGHKISVNHSAIAETVPVKKGDIVGNVGGAIFYPFQ